MKELNWGSKEYIIEAICLSSVDVDIPISDGVECKGFLVEKYSYWRPNKNMRGLKIKVGKNKYEEFYIKLDIKIPLEYYNTHKYLISKDGCGYSGFSLKCLVKNNSGYDNITRVRVYKECQLEKNVDDIKLDCRFIELNIYARVYSIDDLNK